uniref:Uncharacterized protein n=1 Tax=Rhizophora mucronata TaxID=61149 RepID=A0A2P2N877_RHIMU
MIFPTVKIQLNLEKAAASSLFGDRNSMCGRCQESHLNGIPIQIENPTQDSSSLLC